MFDEDEGYYTYHQGTPSEGTTVRENEDEYFKGCAQGRRNILLNDKSTWPEFCASGNGECDCGVSFIYIKKSYNQYYEYIRIDQTDDNYG